MRALPVFNPQNRFASSTVTYDDGETPDQHLEVHEDRTRSILATNDSPDVGFRWSINPYRGCSHACAYCLDGDTAILVGDGSTRALRDVRVGDVVYGTLKRGGVRRLVRTTVRAHWQTMKVAHRVILADGTTLVASADHRFLVDRGWRRVGNLARSPRRARMVGVGRLAATPAVTDDYRLGYLAAVAGSSLDLDAERRARAYLLALDARARAAVLNASGDPTRVRRAVAAFVPWTTEGARGFAAGTFDAGRDRARRTLRDELRFLHVVDPASRRLRDLDGREVETADDLEVVAIENTRVHTAMFDITTGTGDFIANGVVSHNCYARPGHEYLSFSAGTDFEKKIVVKPRAPELLREAFEKKSWKGDLIVFSGVTDCYQPLERTWKLTRGCLEVCAEYRNPVGIITKSPVIERDIDLLQELARVASVRVSVSVPFWDADVAKAMEPWVTTPQRRMKTVELLAKAGIPVGVSVSPIVPGLNDEHLGEVLKAAGDAGATHAFYVLLRLPGAVKEVFENRLRQNLPLRAEKVLRRMREAHGGKLYDHSYGTRQTGGGQYAEMIAALFERTAKRYGLSHDEMRRYEIASTFRRPNRSGQTSFDF